MRRERALLFAIAISGSTFASATEVAVCTDQGRFVIELADARAPKNVENFLRYVDLGFYSGTVFHRVKKNFVVQGGGLDRDFRPRSMLPPVENESRNGLRNTRGSVAAARLDDPSSARSQFFVNLEDNAALDAGKNPGFTVFGHVKDGMEVIDAISRLPTGASGPLKEDVPMPLVAIESIVRLNEEALAALPNEGREAAIKQRIDEAAAAGDDAGALTWVGHYRAVCGAADPSIAIAEARAALALKDQRRAVFALENYFATTERTDPTYEDAVTLYRDAVPEHQQSAANLDDDCDAPAAPEIPDGATATLEQMTAGQASVKTFVAAGGQYLRCLATTIDNAERSAEERNSAIGRHNAMVSAMEQAAKDFNAQIHVFKSR